MLTEVRDNVGESTESHWGDNDLLRKLNLSYRLRATELLSVPGDWLVTSTDLTPSSSVITLPDDCVKPIYLEEKDNGRAIDFSMTIRERRTSRLSGTTLYSGVVDAYFVGNTIEINMDDYGEEVTLWYQRRVPNLHTGTADAGGSTSLTFEVANEPSFEDDYYNGVTIEIVNGTGSRTQTTVLDYVGSTKVATLAAGTYDSDSVYGTVSDLPEEANDFIILDATIRALAKPSAAIDPKYFEHLYSLWKIAKRAWDDFTSTRLSGANRTRITEVG